MLPGRAGRGRSDGGRDDLVLVEVGIVDPVVVEADGVELLEERPDHVLDLRVVVGRHVQDAAFVVGPELVVLDDDLRRP